MSIALMTVVVSFLGLAVYAARQRFERDREQRRSEWIEAELAKLRAGEHSIWCYSTQDTDDLLLNFRGMSEVQGLDFELTDITEKGLIVVAEFPNLQSLTLYGGIPNIDDTGLKRLEGNGTLSDLSLVNTKVTDEGLEVLMTMPNLRSLTLFRDDFREVTLTDRAADTLQKLTQLERLTIGGGWMSDEAVGKLQAALPDCEISTEAHW